jgi:hypothetical protein
MIFETLVFFTAQPFDPADSPRKLHHIENVSLRVDSLHAMAVNAVKFLTFNSVDLE